MSIRQKYTEEEWDEISNSIKKDKSTFNNYLDESFRTTIIQKFVEAYMDTKIEDRVFVSLIAEMAADNIIKTLK